MKIDLKNKDLGEYIKTRQYFIGVEDKIKIIKTDMLKLESELIDLKQSVTNLKYSKLIKNADEKRKKDQVRKQKRKT